MYADTNIAKIEQKCAEMQRITDDNRRQILRNNHGMLLIKKQLHIERKMRQEERVRGRVLTQIKERLRSR